VHSCRDEEYTQPKNGMDSLRAKAQTLFEGQEGPERGVELGDESDGGDSVISSPPSMAIDASIAFENIDPGLWVGKLKVWMELWRYNDCTKGINLADNKRWIAMDEGQSRQDNACWKEPLPNNC